MPLFEESELSPSDIERLRAHYSALLAGEGMPETLPPLFNTPEFALTALERARETSCNTAGREPTVQEVQGEILAAASEIISEAVAAELAGMAIANTQTENIDDYDIATRTTRPASAPEIVTLENELKAEVAAVLDDTLDEREIIILEQRFGLHNRRILPHTEVADAHWTSSSRVKQTEIKALKKIREPLQNNQVIASYLPSPAKAAEGIWPISANLELIRVSQISKATAFVNDALRLLPSSEPWIAQRYSWEHTRQLKRRGRANAQTMAHFVTEKRSGIHHSASEKEAFKRAYESHRTIQAQLTNISEGQWVYTTDQVLDIEMRRVQNELREVTTYLRRKEPRQISITATDEPARRHYGLQAYLKELVLARHAYVRGQF